MSNSGNRLVVNFESISLRQKIVRIYFSLEAMWRKIWEVSLSTFFMSWACSVKYCKHWNNNLKYFRIFYLLGKLKTRSDHCQITKSNSLGSLTLNNKILWKKVITCFGRVYFGSVVYTQLIFIIISFKKAPKLFKML